MVNFRGHGSEEVVVAINARRADPFIEVAHYALERGFRMAREGGLMDSVSRDASQNASDLVPGLVLEAHNRSGSVSFMGAFKCSREEMIAAFKVARYGNGIDKDGQVAGQINMARADTIYQLLDLFCLGNVEVLPLYEVLDVRDIEKTRDTIGPISDCE